jgi:hypothetical protein
VKICENGLHFPYFYAKDYYCSSEGIICPANTIKRTAAALLLCLLQTGTLLAQVVINEYMPLNNATIVDEDGDHEPWLELYNRSDDPYQLQWYGLSDNPQDPWKWIFPEVTVPPGEFLLIWLSGKDRKLAESQLHAGFSPESNGGAIYLTSVQGVLVDTARAPLMPSDHSWGRYPDGTGAFHIHTEPTPDGPNSSLFFTDIMKPPCFSIQPGFYDSPLLLELHHDDPEATIYYTTDGSVPDTTSFRYEGPVGLDHRGEDPDVFSLIRTTPPEGEDREYGWFPPKVPVDKGHTIRAIAVKPGFLASQPATGTWFPGLEQQELPVLSLTAPAHSLFDSEYGIYVPGALYDSLGFGDDVWGRPHANYFQRGEEWEREASIEWFDDGRQIFQQDIGVRIHGGGSRVLPQKSLRLYARSDYGQTHFPAPGLPGGALQRIQAADPAQFGTGLLPSQHHVPGCVHAASGIGPARRNPGLPSLRTLHQR